MAEEPRLGLSLSGGGFRATLYHLGVVRFLADSGMLPQVKRIAAVSGGSVLAAHLVLNWGRYNGGPETFDAAAKEILDFVQKDVRGRIIRRWLLASITILPMLLKRRWRLSEILIREYHKLYRGATLADLNRENENSPQVFFNCTSLTTCETCSFGRSGFMWYPSDSDTEEAVVAPGIPVALAVAASSAFPPLFPPVRIDMDTLSCDRARFPNPYFLTDGGVFDNLGVDRFIWYRRKIVDLDHILISDAGGAVDWDVDNHFGLPLGRNIRASDLLMQRVSAMTYESLKAAGAPVVGIPLNHPVLRPHDKFLLEPEVQRRLQSIRTDLDKFSLPAINALVRHGFSIASDKLVAAGLTPPNTLTPWTPLPRKNLPVATVSEIKAESKRKWRAFSATDPISWVTVFFVLFVATGVIGTPIYRQAIAEQALHKAQKQNEESKTFQNKLNDVALEYFKQRQRPLRPGLSISIENVATAGSICCFVRQHNEKSILLLTADYLSQESNGQRSFFIQPGLFDNGDPATDAIGRVFPESAISISLIKLNADIDATNQITGIGMIKGVVAPPALGESVQIVGRTSGIKRATVTALNVDIPIGESKLRGGVQLSSESGKPTQGGDGGAAVLTADGHLFAIHYAGSGDNSIVVPLKPIFDKLGLVLLDH